MKSWKLMLGGMVLALAAAAGPAQAATLLFSYSDGNSADAFSFEMSSNPTPIVVQTQQIYEAAYKGYVPALLNFVTVVSNVTGNIPSYFWYGQKVDEVAWYSTNHNGRGGLFNSLFQGTQVFVSVPDPLTSPSTFEPVFTTGTFAEKDVLTGRNGTLTVTDISAAAVPEPATWVMMFAGFLGLGAMLRRRRSALAGVAEGALS